MKGCTGFGGIALIGHTEATLSRSQSREWKDHRSVFAHRTVPTRYLTLTLSSSGYFS